MRRLLVVVAALLLSANCVAQERPLVEMPKVLLIGDSIRLSYAATVKQALNGQASVVSPQANAGDSSNLLRGLASILDSERPDVVHFNCGIHDTKRFRDTGEFQVSSAEYEANLRSIVKRIREQTDAVVLFATTTPILDERAAVTRSDRDYELLGASVEQYNRIARKVMRELQVPVNDLHSALTGDSQQVESLIGADGVHLTAAGQRLTGLQVAQFVRQHMPGTAVSTVAGPWKIDAWKEVPAVTWLDRESPIRSLTYRSEPFEGKETDVFAFYATPGSIRGDQSLDHDLPAVVLIHGGGGTAFDEWVRLWAMRGYAAIAMDLSGRRPAPPEFDRQTGELVFNPRVARTRLEHGGPEADHVAKFQNVGGDVTDDWQYHAVAAVMRAHSLIRSFEEVDPDRTAVTGISWGGYMTCLVASLDDRFKAAVPVYGCGFLYEGESVQKPLIDALGDEKRREWIRIYDPSAWLPHCRVPILWVNGTNDKHYPLNSYMRSYDLVPGPKQLRIEAGMRHSHVHGWAPQEIGLFIDQYVNRGVALPRIDQARTDADRVTARVTSKLPVKLAELHYTVDAGPLVDRRWQTAPAELQGETLSATVPEAATVWMLTVTDSRGAMVSTRVFFAE